MNMSERREERLSELAQFLSGGTPRKSEPKFWDGDIPWLTPKDMSDFRGKTADTVTAAALGNGTRQAPAGSLFIAVRGMSLHKEIRVVASEKPITFNQDIKALVPRSINKDFLLYAMRSLERRLLGHVEAAGHGTGRLPSDHLANLMIPRFDTATEDRIANLLSSLDGKIAMNHEINATLEAISQAIFHDWFVDFGPICRKIDGATDPIIVMGGLVSDPRRAQQLADLFPDRFGHRDLPEGWRSGEVREVVTILDSKRVPLSSREREKRKGAFPYHGATGVMDHVDGYLFDEPLLLLGEDGSVVRPDGRPFTQYVWGKIWVNNHAHVLRGQGISVEQLKCFFDAINIAPYVTGAVQLKLNQRNLVSIPFTRADDQVHREFDAVIQPMFSLIRTQTDQIATLIATRNLLLTKLMSGEIDLCEAEEHLQEVA